MCNSSEECTLLSVSRKFDAFSIFGMHDGERIVNTSSIDTMFLMLNVHSKHDFGREKDVTDLHI